MHKRRLLKLAEHLESGKLGHKKFDFSTLNTTDDFTIPRGVCGTLGCAIGECPIAFPMLWRFNPESGTPELLNGTEDFEAAETFFGISMLQGEHLFCPNQQETSAYGGRVLGDHATAQQVAANIRAFVKKMEKDSKNNRQKI